MLAVITTISRPARRVAARLPLLALVAGLGACSHVHNLWPWHHARPPAAPAVTELVVVAAAGANAPILAQTWARNALRVDLTGLAGEGELRLRPVEHHGWPIRLEFAVRPGTFKHLEVRGEQRVTMSVPDAGAVAVLAVPQGLYAPATMELTIHYGP
jgi:hypothetical protein